MHVHIHVHTHARTHACTDKHTHSPVEDVADLFPNVCPQSQELAIDPVQSSLQQVPLPRVLAVEEA